MFKIKYRIVKDNYCEYEVQSKRWWWPFWVQCTSFNENGRSYSINTFDTIDESKKFIKLKKNKKLYKKTQKKIKKNRYIYYD